MTNAALIVKVNIREEGGNFYADSQDVPGLHVVGETHEQVCESALKAVEVLFKHNRHMDVDVVPATQDVEAFPAARRCDGFVIQQRLAA